MLAAAATGQTEDETSEETRRRCLEMLSRARRAMEEGDTESAQSWLEKAEALKVPFKRTAPGDTPAKVRKDLEQASASAKPERREAASEGRRAECDALLVEARKALATGDVRRAQSLADKAERMALEYKSDADSPAKVSAAIQNWSDLAGADAKKRNLVLNPVAWQVQQKLAEQILATPDATVARLKAILGL